MRVIQKKKNWMTKILCVNLAFETHSNSKFSYMELCVSVHSANIWIKWVAWKENDRNRENNVVDWVLEFGSMIFRFNNECHSNLSKNMSSFSVSILSLSPPLSLSLTFGANKQVGIKCVSFYFVRFFSVSFFLFDFRHRNLHINSA